MAGNARHPSFDGYSFFIVWVSERRAGKSGASDLFFTDAFAHGLVEERP